MTLQDTVGHRVGPEDPLLQVCHVKGLSTVKTGFSLNWKEFFNNQIYMETVPRFSTGTSTSKNNWPPIKKFNCDHLMTKNPDFVPSIKEK